MLADLQKKHGFNLIVDRVESIDVNNKTVKLANGEQSYDYLFIALGMNKVTVKGDENTLSICGKPEQAVRIGEELEKLVNAGKGKIAIGFGGNPKDTKGSSMRGPASNCFSISAHI